LVHRCYCQEVRGGAVPLNLVGNAHFDLASSRPSEALALMQQRLRTYIGWAQTRGNGLAKWALKRLGEISNEVGGDLPRSFSTDEKAQFLMGYLARKGREDAEERKA